MRSATFSACSPLFTPLVPANDAHFRFHFFAVYFFACAIIAIPVAVSFVLVRDPPTTVSLS